MIFNRYIREGKREGRLKKQFFSIRSVVLLSIRKDKKRTTKANYNSRCSLSEWQERTKVSKARPVSAGHVPFRRDGSMTESLILAQNERWRRVLSMQVERMATFGWTEAADG